MTCIANLFKSTDELRDPECATVKGDIPQWLNGDILSLGPAVFDINKSDETYTLNHCWDGFGVIVKFSITDTGVTYSKSIIKSDAYKRGCSVGKNVYTEFGTKAHSDSNKNVFQKIMNTMVPELTDNTCGNVYKLGKSIYVSSETNNKRVLNPKTLETGPKIDISQDVRVNMASAHTYTDLDGNAYTMGTYVAAGIKNQVIQINKPEQTAPGKEHTNAKVISSIPPRHKTSITYNHSFGVSKDWIVFIEQPLFLNVMKLITANMKGYAMTDTMEWKPEEKNRFYVVRKSDGKVYPFLYESNSFFFFHHINTYEEKDEIVVDLIGHDSPEIMYSLWLKDLRSDRGYNLKDKATSRRYILPLQSGASRIEEIPEGKNLVKSDNRCQAHRTGNVITVKGCEITPPSYELATVSPRVFGLKYTYFYATGLYDESPYQRSVVKVNATTGEIISWKDSESCFPGEPVFIPSPNPLAEDDGVVVSIVSNMDGGGFLIMLKGSDLSEIARAHVTSHVPTLLHALFLPN